MSYWGFATEVGDLTHCRQDCREYSARRAAAAGGCVICAAEGHSRVVACPSFAWVLPSGGLGVDNVTPADY